MKFRVHYTYFNQHTPKVNNWEQREKDFDTMDEALLFVKRITWTISTTKVRKEPIQDGV